MWSICRLSAVNWTATDKYADAARIRHYMANNAESDYAALAGEVAATSERDRAGQGSAGAAEHGGRRAPAARDRGRAITMAIAPTTCARCSGCSTKRFPS